MTTLKDKLIKQAKTISQAKNEPPWMLNWRLEAVEAIVTQTKPTFGADLTELDYNVLELYKDSAEKKVSDWNEVPQDIRETFEALGIPKAEQQVLAGVEAQMDSEAIYGRVRDFLTKQGVIFTNLEEAVRNYAEIIQKYLGSLVKYDCNLYTALNSAFWSGGSFLYVPANIKLEMPLQAFFQISTPNLGQFERTLIIAETNSEVHYVEGCTAPVYSKDSLHAGVVEVFVKENANVKYTTIQNWSKNIYNLATKKALVAKNGTMTWVDGNIGSKVTMKYPACYLEGEGAHGELISLALTGSDQDIHAGGRMIHIAPNTTSKITSKTVVGHGGKNVYMGEVVIGPDAKGAKAHVECDSLLLAPGAISQSFPKMKVEEPSAEVTHEATTNFIEARKLIYLQRRGLSEKEARDIIVEGFLNSSIKELPIEYALEFNKLISLKIE